MHYLQLFNEHGRELNSQEIVENALVYTVDDQDTQVKGKRLGATTLIEYYRGYKFTPLFELPRVPHPVVAVDGCAVIYTRAAIRVRATVQLDV